MPNEDLKKSFLKGYEEGLRDGFNEVLRLVGQGYSAMELSVLVKSKMAVLHRSVEAMEDRIAAGKVPLEEVEGKTFTPTRITRRASYLVSERKPEGLFQLVQSMEAGGVRTLCISRIHPGDLVSKYRLDKVHIVWLTQSSEAPKQKNVAHVGATNLVGLVSSIDQFLKGEGHAVALEGVEYLISQNGFEAVLRCVQQVNEKARTRDAYLLVSVDPKAVGDKEYDLLARELGNEL